MAIGMLAGYELEKNLNWRNHYTNTYSSSSIQQVMDLVNLKYVDSLPTDSIEADGIEAIVNRLDPHSVYIPPVTLGDVNADLQGNFSGIGVEYQMISDTLNVVYVLERGPSDRAGVKVGDQIIKVDTVNIAGREKQGRDLRNYLRGKAGSKIKITLVRDGKTLQTQITRGSIPIPSLDAAYMAAPGVGYIKLNKFAETTYREFMDAATRLQAAGMKKMILDLRGNGGGLLEQATNIADELLEDGKKIVSTRGNHVKTREIDSNKPGIFEEGQLVLLLDEFSASASEVLAGALQDNDRCTIIGRRSFGKGLVQEQYNLSNGGALRLTVARYYTPTGRSIQKPYTKGENEKYREEIADRFHNGDNYKIDTLHAKVFKTRAGKKLYEAGGIMPDIIIPLDSTIITRAVLALYNNEVLNDYMFSVFKQQQPVIKKYKSAAEMVTSYSLPSTVWPGLEAYAKKDSIPLNNINGKAKQQLELRMKALLARYQWRSGGYYEVLNNNDTIFRKALEVLQ
jgi:carboxyl-terminal processing protease